MQLEHISGLKVYESNLLTDNGADTSDEYVLYDSEAYSIIYALESVRLINAIEFNGSYAQVQMIAGFKVTLPEAVIVKRSISAAPTVVVTFDSAGGDAVSAQNVVIGGLVSEPSVDPTLENYTFVRWDLGNLPYDFTTKVTGAITLTAIWTASE